MVDLTVSGCGGATDERCPAVNTCNCWLFDTNKQMPQNVLFRRRCKHVFYKYINNLITMSCIIYFLKSVKCIKMFFKDYFAMKSNN